MKPSDETALTWLRLPGRMDNLGPFRDFVLAHAQVCALPQTVQGRIDLVLEEVLVNIFDHAFGNEPAGLVAVGCGMDPDKRFWLCITDPGPAFDPLKMPSPDTALDLDHRQAGGLGIHLARRMSSNMRYRREDGRNVLDIYFWMDAK